MAINYPPLSRLADEQPGACTHPGWCALEHGDDNFHASQYVLAETTGVIVVQKAGPRPHVWISGRAYLPEDARAIGGLLSRLGHAELAAAVTRAAEMSES
jgi:hypothetical protein